MEEDLNGSHPQLKTPKWKTTSMEDDLNGTPLLKNILMEVNLNGNLQPYRNPMTLVCLAR